MNNISSESVTDGLSSLTPLAQSFLKYAIEKGIEIGLDNIGEAAGGTIGTILGGPIGFTIGFGVGLGVDFVVDKFFEALDQSTQTTMTWDYASSSYNRIPTFAPCDYIYFSTNSYVFKWTDAGTPNKSIMIGPKITIGIPQELTSSGGTENGSYPFYISGNIVDIISSGS